MNKKNQSGRPKKSKWKMIKKFKIEDNRKIKLEDDPKINDKKIQNGRRPKKIKMKKKK